MPAMRAHLRSSDSVDFEHTETMRQIEELTYAENEYVSPKVEVPVSFSATYPGTTADRVPLTKSTRTSRSNSKVSIIDAMAEKIVVFRDNEDDAPPVMSKFKAGQYSHIENSRSITNPATNDFPSTPQGERSFNASTEIEEVTKLVPSAAHLVRQLQHIAGKRAALLEQLGALQDEENNLLAQLADLIPLTRLESVLRPEREVTAVAPLNWALNAPLLPLPTALRISSKLPSKSTHRPLHTRTTSAPMLTTPSGPRNLGQSKAKRIPLGDKTEGLLVTTDTTTPYVGDSPFFPATRLLQAGRADIETGLNGARKVASRIPTKFSDEPTLPKTQQVTPVRPPRDVSGRVKSLSQSRSKSRSRSKGRRPTTPGIAKPYEVPHTVARKQWDF